MQRRVSQPHQRSITSDKYDEIIKSVLYPEKVKNIIFFNLFFLTKCMIKKQRNSHSQRLQSLEQMQYLNSRNN